MIMTFALWEIVLQLNQVLVEINQFQIFQALVRNLIQIELLNFEKSIKS